MTLDMLADGDYVGDQKWMDSRGTWGFTVTAVTPCTVLAVTRQALEEITDRSAALRAHLKGFQAQIHQPQNKHGEAPVELTAGHTGKHELAARSSTTRSRPANMS